MRCDTHAYYGYVSSRQIQSVTPASQQQTQPPYHTVGVTSLTCRSTIQHTVAIAINVTPPPPANVPTLTLSRDDRGHHWSTNNGMPISRSHPAFFSCNSDGSSIGWEHCSQQQQWSFRHDNILGPRTLTLEPCFCVIVCSSKSSHLSCGNRGNDPVMTR